MFSENVVGQISWRVPLEMFLKKLRISVSFFEETRYSRCREIREGVVALHEIAIFLQNWTFPAQGKNKSMPFFCQRGPADRASQN